MYQDTIIYRAYTIVNESLAHKQVTTVFSNTAQPANGILSQIIHYGSSQYDHSIPDDRRCDV